MAKTVNGLSCSFRNNVLLVWVSFACVVINFIMIASHILESLNNPFGMVVGVMGGGQEGIFALLSLVSSASIVALFYFFSKGCAILDDKVQSSANMLFYLMSANLFITLLNLLGVGGLVISVISLLITIVLYVFMYMLGKQLYTAYDGAAEKVGNNMMNYVKYVVALIIAVIVILVLSQILIKNLSSDLGIVVGILGIAMLLFGIFMFFYLYFAVYMKIARLLDADYDGDNNTDTESTKMI